MLCGIGDCENAVENLIFYCTLCRAYFCTLDCLGEHEASFEDVEIKREALGI